MKPQILFVDDQPNVLDGLRRMLRPQRHEWDMEFAPGGAEALAALERAPFDILITDMRMPGMDGAQLLDEVRRRFPRIVRIVLSGQYDREAALRSVALAHRSLTKPCDAETLKETIARTCALRQLLRNESLLRLASQLQTVPSLPALHAQVLKELDAPEPSLHTIGQIVGRDIGMTAKIMQVVNSAFFGVRGSVAGPAQAVVLLGTETTRVLVLAANVFSRFDSAGVPPYTPDALWQHGLQASGLARLIARAERAGDEAVNQAALGGLLHDVGRLVLVAHQPELYRQVLDVARRERLSQDDAERRVLGATHAEVGAYVLGLWGFPDPVVEAVAWHRAPGECPGDTFSPLTAVHAADALLAEGKGEGSASAEAPLDLNYFTRLGLAGRVEEWRTLRPAP